MAIYLARVSAISRSAGRSATAAAAYRAGAKIVDFRSGEIHDYSRRKGVESVHLFAPVNCRSPNLDTLWNSAELAEKRKNSTVARELLIALPHELNAEQRAELVESVCQDLADRYAVAGSAAIHTPDREGDHRNHHAHILFTTRRMDASGHLGEKTREIDDKTQGKQEVRWMREMVEKRTNDALAANGVSARIDHRSLKDQNAAALASGDKVTAIETDRAPTIYEGPSVTAIRREAKRLGKECTSTLAQVNDMRRDLRELAQVNAQIYYFEHVAPQQAAAAAERQRQQAAQEHGRKLAELRNKVQKARDELQKAQLDARRLQAFLAAPAPEFIAVVKRKKAEVEHALNSARLWRNEHPLKAWIADKSRTRPDIERSAAAVLADYQRSPELEAANLWIADRAKAKAELAEIELRLPLLNEHPQSAEDELLVHAGYDTVMSAIELIMERTQRQAARMDPAIQGWYQKKQEALRERSNTDDVPLLVKVYRDFELLHKEAVLQASTWAQVRSLELLQQVRSSIADLRRQANMTSIPALSEHDARAKEWLLDPSKRPSLDEIETFSAEVSELVEYVLTTLNERAKIKPDRKIDSPQRPSGVDVAKKKDGPSLG